MGRGQHITKKSLGGIFKAPRNVDESVPIESKKGIWKSSQKCHLVRENFIHSAPDESGRTGQSSFAPIARRRRTLSYSECSRKGELNGYVGIKKVIG